MHVRLFRLGVGDEEPGRRRRTVAFWGADGFGLVVAGIGASLQESSGLRVVRLSDSDAVDRGIELPVAVDV